MLSAFSISLQGNGHKKTNTECQDYSLVRSLESTPQHPALQLCAIADGVGSMKYSQFGAEVSVKAAVRSAEEHIDGCFDNGKANDQAVRNLLQGAFEDAVDAAVEQADRMNLPVPQMDSTLTLALYDGSNLWYGHVGDDGLVALYTDSTYELVTRRMKGQEANTMYPLRFTNLWEFGKARKNTASFVLMTDGLLNMCVGMEDMHNRVYFPFLKPAMTEVLDTKEKLMAEREAWLQYLNLPESDEKSVRQVVSDDITFVLAENSDLVRALPEIPFDRDQWEAETRERDARVQRILYPDSDSSGNSRKKPEDRPELRRSEEEKKTSSVQGTGQPDDSVIPVILPENSGNAGEAGALRSGQTPGKTGSISAEGPSGGFRIPISAGADLETPAASPDRSSQTSGKKPSEAVPIPVSGPEDKRKKDKSVPENFPGLEDAGQENEGQTIPLQKYGLHHTAMPGTDTPPETT